MSLAILTARSGLFHPNKRLLEAAAKLRMKTCLIHPKDLVLGSDKAILWKKGRLKVSTVLVRIGSTINPYAMALVRALEDAGIMVISRPESIRVARHKFLSLMKLKERGILVPKSYFVSNKKNLLYAIRRLGGLPVVIKASWGRQGEGVWLVRRMEEVDELMGKVNAPLNGLVVQEFLNGKEVMHIRCLVVGDRSIGAMALVPKRGEFRANVHMGAKGMLLRPDKDIEEVASLSSKTLGLEVAGVDLIRSDGQVYVLEVNYSPGFRGFEKVTGVDVAGHIMEYIRTVMG